mmetsp:Transcript_7121/g.16429  ORF Transcript_7121/g.16429 Transcript_7121/m.16429 type:complete len:266 (-) Transcript_7121:2896-3693(-)
MSAWVVCDTTDSADMADGIIKQNQVHGGICLVVLIQLVFDHLLERRHVFGQQVVPIVALRLRDERRHDQWLCKEVVLRDASEVFRCGLLKDCMQLTLVCGIDQPVREDAVAFVKPHPRKLSGSVLVHVRIGAQQTLEDVADILEVELVVELRRRRQKVGVVQNAQDQDLDRSLHNGLAQFLDRRHKTSQVLLQDRTVDSRNGLAVGRERGQHREAPLETRVHHERAGLGVHARREKNVDQIAFVLQRSTIIDLTVCQHLRQQHDG